MYFQNVSIIALFALALLSLTESYNVLVLGPCHGKSHALFMQSIVKKLLERSHKVTYVTSTSMGKEKIANYTEVLIDPPLDFNSNCKSISSSSYLIINK